MSATYSTRIDLPAETRAEWMTARPGTDTALMIGIVHSLVGEGLHDQAFLERYTEGTAMGFDTLMLDQLSLGRAPRSFAFDGYWLDIGRPDDYDRVNAEFGLIKGSLLKEA